MQRLSLVICVYNPDDEIFQRCITSVSRLRGLELHEIVIIDNNSNPSILSRRYVQAFIDGAANARVIVEQQQGLSHARMRGVRETKYDWVLFIDDDNELDSAYLEQLVGIVEAEASLGVVGPGSVTAVFPQGKPGWISPELLKSFQQKLIVEPEYTSNIGLWLPPYPPGTCQCVRRYVLTTYMQAFSEGRLSASDRKGASLSSAGDSQIIWTALLLKFKVGQHPMLIVNHLIPRKRTGLKYLLRLHKSITESGVHAYMEMFAHRNDYQVAEPSDATTLIYVAKCFARYLLSVGMCKHFLTQIATQLGYHYGYNTFRHKTIHPLIAWLHRKMTA